MCTEQAIQKKGILNNPIMEQSKTMKHSFNQKEGKKIWGKENNVQMGQMENWQDDKFKLNHIKITSYAKCLNTPIKKQRLSD